MRDPVRRLVVGPAAGDLRRRLGPTAWVVLEELLARSTDAGGCRQASVSVRSLASEVGLSKDTVARALSRLRRAGLVTACQPRSTAGTFAAGRYLIVVPNAVASIEDQTVDGPEPRRSRLQQSALKPVRSGRPRDAQLALSLDG